MARMGKARPWAAAGLGLAACWPAPAWADAAGNEITSSTPTAAAASNEVLGLGDVDLTSYCDGSGEASCGAANCGSPACGSAIAGGLLAGGYVGPVGAMDPWVFTFTQTVDYGTNLALPISLTPLNTPVGPLSDPTASGIIDSIGLLDPLDPPVARFEDDFQFQTTAGAVRNWNLDDDSSFSAGYSYYQNLHPEVESLDLMSHTALANYSRRVSDDAILGLDYNYVYYFLDGSSFVSQNTVTPTLLMRWNDRWDVKGTCSYGNANFRDTPFINSDNYAATLEGLRYVDAARRSFLTFGSGYGYSNAFDDSFSYNVPNVFVGGQWYLPDERWQFSIVGSYYLYRFQGVDPIETERREDDIYSINPILYRTINEHMQLFASYTYYNSDSNIERQDYDQSLISLGAYVLW
jgi:hypothetical protein